MARVDQGASLGQ